MIRLILATRNEHKVGEIRAILGPGFRCQALGEYAGAPETVEDAGTFSGNATKKAVTLAHWLAAARVPRVEPGEAVYVLADDSGLEVDALGGAPGVHSARFAALDTGAPGNSPTSANNAKLLRLLKDVPAEKRAARFRCVLALIPLLEPAEQGASPVCYADEFELRTELFEGVCPGRIEFAPRGDHGFGYDPLFVPDGYTQTFGELSETIKDVVSHRARALVKLKERLK